MTYNTIYKQAGFGTNYITDYRPEKELSLQELLDVIKLLENNLTIASLAGAGLGGAAGYFLGKNIGSTPAIGGTSLGLAGIVGGSLLGHYINKKINISKLEDKYNVDAPFGSLFNRDVLMASLAGNSEKELDRVRTASKERAIKSSLDKFRYGINYLI